VAGIRLPASKRVWAAVPPKGGFAETAVHTRVSPGAVNRPLRGCAPPAVGVVVNWGVTIPALRFLVRGMHGGCSWGRPRPLGVRGRPVRNGSVVEWCAHDLTRLSEALACEPEDGGAVDESVGTGDGCCLGWEEGLPVAESPIRC